MAVSQEITRSSERMTAAASTMATSLNLLPRSTIGKSTRPPVRSQPLLQADQPHALDSRQRGKARQRHRSNAVVAEIGIALPDDADAQPSSPPMPTATALTKCFVGRQIGHIGGNRRQIGLEQPWQRHQRGKNVERREWLVLDHRTRCPPDTLRRANRKQIPWQPRYAPAQFLTSGA